MSIISFRLDDILQFQNDTQILDTRLKDITFIETYFQKNKITLTNIETIDCKSIKQTLTSKVKTTFSNNFYLNHLLESINHLNFECTNIKSYLEHFRTFIIKKCKEEITKLETDNNYIQTDESKYEDFLLFLNNMKCTFTKSIENELIKLLELSNENTNFSEYYITCYINNEKKIIASCLQQAFIFRQHIHLTQFCGDYIPLIKYMFKIYFNYNYTIKLTEDINIFTPKYIADMVNINCNLKDISLKDNMITTIYTYKANSKNNSKNTIFEDLTKLINIEIENNILKFTCKYDYLANLYINKDISNIPAFYNYLLKCLQFNIIQQKYEYLKSKLQFVYYIEIHDFNNKIKNNLFDLFIVLLKLVKNKNTIVQTINYQFTKDIHIKQIIATHLNKNNTLENIIKNEMKQCNNCYLDIDKSNSTLIDYAKALNIFSNSISYTTSILNENINCIRLSPLKTFNYEKQQQEEQNILDKINCRANLIFSTTNLFYYPEKTTPKFLYCGTKSTINKNNNNELDVYVNVFTEAKKSEICLINLDKDTIDKNEVEMFMPLLLSDNIKLVVLCAESYYLFIMYKKDITTDKIKIENMIYLFIDFVNNSNTISDDFYIEKYTRSDILNRDEIIIYYDKKSSTCFTDTAEFNSNEILEGEVRKINMDMENIGPFYQLDDRLMHVYNNEIDIYDEDNRDDMNRQYLYTFYEYGMLMEEFNKFGIPEDDPGDVLAEEDKVTLTEDEYIEVYNDYSVFSRNEIQESDNSVLDNSLSEYPAKRETKETEEAEEEFEKDMKDYEKLQSMFEGEKYDGIIKEDIDIEQEDIIVEKVRTLKRKK
jgi:hypothetical protein